MSARKSRAFGARLRFALGAFRRCRGREDPLHEHYRRAVQALPTRQREIFRLHRVDGLSMAEIAARLGAPCSDIEREFGKALLALVRAMEPHD